MARFVQRIVGALALNPDTYEDIEHDQNATVQALGVVVLSSLAASIGAGGGLSINGVVGHLLSQFTGRTQDQRTRHRSLEMTRIGGVFAAGFLGQWFACSLGSSHFFGPLTFLFGVSSLLLGQQGMQDWQQKGRRLATAGLARNHQVVLGLRFGVMQRQRNGLRLDRCRGREAKIGNGV